MKYQLLVTAFILASFNEVAGQVRDTIQADTVIRNRFLPAGVRIGLDLVSPIKSQVRDNFSGWEANADMDIHRYILTADVGNWSVTGQHVFQDPVDSSTNTSSYNNSGSYWRAGASANFLTRDPQRNAFFIGFKYARASYRESMTFMANDSIWGLGQANYSADKKSARWLELTSGLKIQIWKFIWMGYTGSLKFALKADDSNGIISHDIPGYGKTFRDTTWGFTYHVFFRIPFRPTTSILPPKKKK
jgi:hypothetical protein